MAKLMKLLNTVQQIFNNGGVENAVVSFDCKSDRLRLRVEMNECALRFGNLEGITVSKGLIYVEDINLELPPREIIKTASVRVESLVIRLSAGLFSRILGSDEAKKAISRLPVAMKGLSFALSGNLITMRGVVHQGLSFPFSIDLKPEVKNNKIRVVFANFWAADMMPMPGFMRRMLMSIVSKKLIGKEKLKGVVSIDDDVITVNPWSKIPIDLHTEIRRFGIEGHNIILELGAAPLRSGQEKQSSDSRACDSKGAVEPAESRVAKNGKGGAEAKGDTSSHPTPKKADVAAQKVVMPAGDDNEPVVLPFV